MRSKVKTLSVAAAGKPSLNRAKLVARSRPETRRPIHVQVEVGVKPHGGPNSLTLKS